MFWMLHLLQLRPQEVVLLLASMMGAQLQLLLINIRVSILLVLEVLMFLLLELVWELQPRPCRCNLVHLHQLLLLWMGVQFFLLAIPHFTLLLHQTQVLCRLCEDHHQLLLVLLLSHPLQLLQHQILFRLGCSHQCLHSLHYIPISWIPSLGFVIRPSMAYLASKQQPLLDIPCHHHILLLQLPHMLLTIQAKKEPYAVSFSREYDLNTGVYRILVCQLSLPTGKGPVSTRNLSVLELLTKAI